MERALFEYLNNNMTSVAVYYLKAPDNAGFPRVVFIPISENRQHDTEFRRTRTQISIWDPDRYNGLALREEIYSHLQRFKGIMEGERVCYINADAQQVFYEAEIRAYYYAIDFLITYIGEQ